MSKNEINKVIEDNSICRIAFIDGEYPYIAPFQYIYEGGNLYFHFTDYGKKKKILRKNKHVCVSIEELATELDNYAFISIQGTLDLVNDEETQKKIAKIMMKQASKKFSKEFLKAHGFESDKEWNSLEVSKEILIYRLIEKGKRIGLKSK